MKSPISNLQSQRPRRPHAPPLITPIPPLLPISRLPATPGALLNDVAGVTSSISPNRLHPHRYAWAEPALQCGYPERFAQQALGHNSKAVHHAFSKHAEVTVPLLDDWEKQWKKNPPGRETPKVVALDLQEQQRSAGRIAPYTAKGAFVPSSLCIVPIHTLGSTFF